MRRRRDEEEGDGQDEGGRGGERGEVGTKGECEKQDEKRTQ